MEFGMQDANGYTVMLMNKSATDYSFSVKFSTASGNYSAANTTLKFRFNANVNIDFSNQTLFKNSTLLFTFDAAGNMTRKIEYRSGYAAPVTTNYNVNTPPTVSITAPSNGASVSSGTSITVSATASDTAPGTVTSVSFYDGATLIGSDATSPYSIVWSGASVGTHSITARATDNGGAVTTSAAVSITVTAVSSDPLTQSYFHVVNKWTADYLRPKDGLTTSLIVQDAEATVPTFSSFQWEFRAAPTSGFYHIVNKYTGLAIQPTNGSIADNATISQVTLTTSNAGNTELQWAIEVATVDPGYYWIKNRKSGLYIRPAGGSTVDLTNIVQNPMNTTYSSFRWSLVNQGAKAARSATEFSEEIVKTTSVYPNPVTDVITVVTEVENRSTVSVSIYNIFGTQVLSEDFEDIQGHFEKRFDISDFSSGAFILKVKKGSSIESKKIIKE
jgi:hypothetical protein